LLEQAMRLACANPLLTLFDFWVYSRLEILQGCNQLVQSQAEDLEKIAELYVSGQHQTQSCVLTMCAKTRAAVLARIGAHQYSEEHACNSTVFQLRPNVK